MRVCYYSLFFFLFFPSYFGFSDTEFFEKERKKIMCMYVVVHAGSSTGTDTACAK